MTASVARKMDKLLNQVDEKESREHDGFSNVIASVRSCSTFQCLPELGKRELVQSLRSFQFPYGRGIARRHNPFNIDVDTPAINAHFWQFRAKKGHPKQKIQQ